MTNFQAFPRDYDQVMRARNVLARYIRLEKYNSERRDWRFQNDWPIQKLRNLIATAPDCQEIVNTLRDTIIPKNEQIKPKRPDENASYHHLCKTQGGAWSMKIRHNGQRITGYFHSLENALLMRDITLEKLRKM